MQTLTDAPQIPADRRPCVEKGTCCEEEKSAEARVCIVCDEAAAQLGSETSERKKSQQRNGNWGIEPRVSDDTRSTADLDAEGANKTASSGAPVADAKHYAEVAEAGKQSIVQELQRKLTVQSQK